MKSHLISAVFGAFVSVVILQGIGTLGAAQTTPVPTAASGRVGLDGVVTVSGNVNVANTPKVEARQAGAWSVSLAGSPLVRLAAPAFLERGRAYTFTWSTGQTCANCTVINALEGGWVQVNDPARSGRSETTRWVNAALAVTIE